MLDDVSSQMISIKSRKCPSTSEDQMLLAESIIRSYLTHLRSIYSFPPHHSSSSSMGQLFLSVEYQYLKDMERNLSNQMENLLEIFVSSNGSLIEKNSFVRSILYSNPNHLDHFIANYGLALESISKSTSNNINLKYLFRRKQFVQLICVEQQRQQEEDFVFQFDEQTPSNDVLSLTGIHSIIDKHLKSIRISLKEKCSEQKRSFLIFPFAEFCFVPIFHSNPIPSLLSLSLDEPHL